MWRAEARRGFGSSTARRWSRLIHSAATASRREFYVMHHMNVDSKGNLYVTEVQDGKRIQKFVFKRHGAGADALAWRAALSR